MRRAWHGDPKERSPMEQIASYCAKNVEKWAGDNQSGRSGHGGSGHGGNGPSNRQKSTKDSKAGKPRK